MARHSRRTLPPGPSSVGTAASRRSALLAGIAFSLIVETTQLAISVLLGFTYKIADIDDLILNSAGVVVGYAGFLLLRTAFDEDLTTEGAIDTTAPS